jgi:4-amino-4-deoxy-L-arabinose transferase-like glycosyltransferase
VTARLPNVAVSVLSIAGARRPERRAAGGGKRATLLAALLLALNPLAIGSSPTAFTDPLMVPGWAAATALALAQPGGWHVGRGSRPGECS